MNIFTRFCTLKAIKHNRGALFGFGLLVCLVLLIISLSIGVSGISLTDVLKWLTGNSIDNKVRNIVLYVRLPRTIAALLCGGALALSGLLLQSTLNNALASPGTIGINAGAGLFVVASSVIFPAYFFARTLAAFLGAMIITLCVYAIAGKSGASRMTIILSGIAITSLCSAIIDAITTINPSALLDKASFYIGGLGHTTIEQTLFSIPCIVFGLIGSIVLAPKINILALGDEVASSLGVHVKKTRFFVVLCASALAAGAVSIAGLLGFVGLIVPHIMRSILNNDFKILLPFTVIFGGALVLCCDMLARTIFMPFEVPVGIILSCLGAPFFLFLIFKGGRRGRFHD